jgi:hypothetical protein
MKNIILSIMLMTGITHSQTVYEVTPGTKGNEIKLTVANVSEENAATEVIIKSPTKPPLRGGLEGEVITFHQSEKTIDIIEAKAEAEVKFTFDVNRNAPISRKDTVEFEITSSDGIMMTKSFIFSYTAPKEFKLEQNFPNPFNPTTTIQYNIPETPLPLGKGLGVRLIVYDVLGSEVVTLVNEEQDAGYYEVKFDAGSYASGIYIYRLTVGNFVSVKKMMVVK